MIVSNTMTTGQHEFSSHIQHKILMCLMMLSMVFVMITMAKSSRENT